MRVLKKNVYWLYFCLFFSFSSPIELRRKNTTPKVKKKKTLAEGEDDASANGGPSGYRETTTVSRHTNAGSICVHFFYYCFII